MAAAKRPVTVSNALDAASVVDETTPLVEVDALQVEVPKPEVPTSPEVLGSPTLAEEKATVVVASEPEKAFKRFRVMKSMEFYRRGQSIRYAEGRILSEESLGIEAIHGLHEMGLQLELIE